MENKFYAQFCDQSEDPELAINSSPPGQFGGKTTDDIF